MTKHARTAGLTFRAEVVDAHTNRWLGHIRLVQPLSSYLVVGCALVVAAALVLFLGLASVSKKVPASGMLARAERAAGSAAPLVAQLYVSAAHIGLLQSGLDVTLRFSALPYPRYEQQHGVIGAVSYVPLYSSAPGAPARPVPLYLVTVALPRQFVSGQGRNHALQPGMLVEASVVRERRALWRWMFEPLSTHLDQP